MGRSTLALTFSSAAYIATGYVVTVALARLLGPADLGIYLAATALLTVVNFVVSRGVPIAASRRIAREPEAAAAVMRVAWRTTAQLALATMAVAFVLSWPAGRLLGSDVQPLLQIGALAAVTFGVQALVLAPLNGLQLFRWQATSRTTYAVARLALIVAGATLAGPVGAIAGFVAAPLVASLPSLRPSLRLGRTGRISVASSPAPDGRRLLLEGVPLLATAVSVSLLLTVDLIAYKAVGAAQQVGIYGAAATLAHVPFYLLAALPIEVLPRVAAARDAERRALATRLLDDAVWMTAVPTAALIAVGPLLVEPIFGSRFATGDVLVAPLALATAAITVHSVLVAIDAAAHRLAPAVVVGGLSMVAMAAAVAGAASAGGALYAAWAAAAVGLGCVVAHWIVSSLQQRVAQPALASWLLAAALTAAAVLDSVAGGSAAAALAGGAVALGVAVLGGTRIMHALRYRSTAQSR